MLTRSHIIALLSLRTSQLFASRESFFSSHRELHAAIGKVMDQISIKTSFAIFKHQMERPEQVSQNNNDEDQ
jgi:hypothetical protein